MDNNTEDDNGKKIYIINTQNMVNNMKNNLFECQCGGQFTLINYLTDHILSCEEADRVKCKYCNYYVDRNFYYYHVNRLCSNVNTKCKICGNTVYKSTYYKHKQTCKFIECVRCSEDIIISRYEEHYKYCKKKLS